MQEEKQGTDTFLFPKGSPKEGYQENSTAPSSLQNSQDHNDHFEAKDNQNINGKLESVKYNIEKSDIEKMNTENNTTSGVMNESPPNKVDEQADEKSAKIPVETSDIEKMNIENNTTPPVMEESQPSKIDERAHDTKLVEKMNTENISNSLTFQKSPQDKAKVDEQAHSKDHLPISTSQSTSYSSQFVLHNIPLVSSIDELASAIKHELQKYGEVVKIESQSKSENLVDVNLSFKHDKDAVKALMSNAKIHLGEQDFILNIIPGFKDYLVKLSSTVKRPSNSQTAAKQNPEITKSEPVIKENSVQNEEKDLKKTVVNPSENELSKPSNNDKLSENKKIIIKASGKRNEVPLEIRKPTKSAKSIPNASSNEKIDSSNHLAPPVANVSNSQQQKRSRTKSKSREKERLSTLQVKPELKGNANAKTKSDRSLSRKSKKLAKRKELRESSQQVRQAKIEQRKESFNREENKNKDKDLHIEKKNIESTRNLDRKDNLLVIKKARPDHKDVEKANHHNHHHHHQIHRSNDRASWTDDEIPCEFVCYTIGIPLECDISFIRDFLQREGFYPHIKMQWKNFEGLDYLKLVFDSKSETQKFLSRQISLYEIPIIVLPKLPNKNPLEMLGYHQLRVESLSGPIESESVYEFLLKFGPITDFLVLDSMNSPTTFLVTFTNNSSKRTLESYYSKAPALLADKYNNERQLKVEFNIKPALVVRKKLNMTIIHQYKEAQRQIQAPVKQQFLEEETGMNQVPTPNSVINSFNMQGPPITQTNSKYYVKNNVIKVVDVVSPIPSTRSGSIHYSPPNPGYMNPNYVNENQGYFNMPQQGGYAYPRQDPVIYNPNQSINNFPNYDPNINANQDLQRNMLPVYQLPQVPQRFETPVQNLYMGNPNQMMTTQTFGMPQVVNNGMYGNAPSPYTDMRMNGNYPVGGNPQYSFPNQDGRNNMQYFY